MQLCSVSIRPIGLLKYGTFGVFCGFLPEGRRRGVIYRGSRVTYRRSGDSSTCKVQCSVSGLNYYLNSNRTKHLALSLRPIFFTFWKISIAAFPLLWRHLPTEVRNVQCVAKYIWSCNIWRKQRPNRCIIGDAILPQTGKKLTKKCGSEFGALLWRHLTPHRKGAIQVHNYSPSGA